MLKLKTTLNSKFQARMTSMTDELTSFINTINIIILILKRSYASEPHPGAASRTS